MLQNGAHDQWFREAFSIFLQKKSTTVDINKLLLFTQQRKLLGELVSHK